MSRVPKNGTLAMILGLLLLTGICPGSYAGSLEPPGAPAPTKGSREIPRQTRTRRPSALSLSGSPKEESRAIERSRGRHPVGVIIRTTSAHRF